jgi:hypothetical protein
VNTDGENFLEELRGSTAHTSTFEGRFCRIATRLGLGVFLSRDELGSLYQAALDATLCNIAFNGKGGCNGKIRAQREPSRRRLEQAFMEARDRFFASAGWKALPQPEQCSVIRIFLTVFVDEDNLAR